MTMRRLHPRPRALTTVQAVALHNALRSGVYPTHRNTLNPKHPEVCARLAANGLLFRSGPGMYVLTHEGRKRIDPFYALIWRLRTNEHEAISKTDHWTPLYDHRYLARRLEQAGLVETKGGGIREALWVRLTETGRRGTVPNLTSFQATQPVALTHGEPIEEIEKRSNDA